MDEVAVYTSKWFRAKNEVVFKRFHPAVLGAGLEVLTTRVNYMRRAHDGFGVNGYPGFFCTGQWPPRAFGPTEEAIGFKMFPGDIVAVTFFLRVTKPGTWRSEGLQVEYTTPGNDEMRLIETMETNDLVLVAAARESSLPDGKVNCGPDLPRTWLGFDGHDRVVVHSPSARASRQGTE